MQKNHIIILAAIYIIAISTFTIYHTQKNSSFTKEDEDFCKLMTSSGSYDLNPLKRTYPNVYQVRASNKSFLLNFCWHAFNYPCYRYDPAVKIQNQHCYTIGRDYKNANLSEIRSGNGGVLVRYRSGESIIPGINYETEIRVLCNPRNNNTGSVIFDGEELRGNKLVNKFQIASPHGCPKRNQTCMISTPFGYKYDLRNLTSLYYGYNIYSGNLRYHFNICGDVSSSCGSVPSVYYNGARSCYRLSRSYKGNDMVLAEERGIATLLYKNGERNQRGQTYQTKINFYCSYYTSYRLGLPQITPEHITFVIDFYSPSGCRVYNKNNLKAKAFIGPLRTKTSQNVMSEIKKLMEKHQK